MNSQINRREFLKLISLLPLVVTDYPTKLQSSFHTQNAPNRPNILIIVFDALSAHHMSLYGYNRETTPNLARFADHATVYHNHYAGGSFTSPGTASILTGTYSWTNRAFHLHGTVDEKLVDRNIFNQFRDLGYTRLGYSHNLLVTSLLYQFRNDLDTFHWTRELCRVDDQFSDRIFPNDYNLAFWAEWILFRGGETKPASLFSSLIHRFYRSLNKRSLSSDLGELFPRGIPNLHNLLFILEDATNWLMDQVVSLPQPYLMYFHGLPPHEPYSTRRDFIDIFADGWKPPEKPVRYFSEGHSQDFLNQNRREYDEYLAYADTEFGRLHDFMQQNGKLDDTIIIFTSDHGELFERGIRGHVTQAIYQPVIQVPLLISYPGQKIRNDIYTPTSNNDILPTLLQLIHQPIPEWVEGEVLPPFNDLEDPSQREVYSIDAKSNPKNRPLSEASISLVKGKWKLVHYTGYDENIPAYELYDLENDPAELNNIQNSAKEDFEELRTILNRKLEQVNNPYM